LPIKSEFTQYIVESLSTEIEDIRSKKMFGGYGIYADNLMFALVSNEELYLKVDSKNIDKFKELNLKPFTYTRKNKDIEMSYYQAPASAIEDPEILAEWASLSISAANRKT
jgi:DNA transformation protein